MNSAMNSVVNYETPAQRQERRIMTVLGQSNGWRVVRVDVYENGATVRCQATGKMLRYGVLLRNETIEKTVLVGRGVVKKYTDARIPTKTKGLPVVRI